MSGTVVTVTEAAQVLRCGRTRVFELLATGRLVRGERFGRETVVTIASLEALQTRQVGRPSAPKRRWSRHGGAGLANAIRSLPLGGSP